MAAWRRGESQYELLERAHRQKEGEGEGEDAPADVEEEALRGRVGRRKATGLGLRIDDEVVRVLLRDVEQARVRYRSAGSPQGAKIGRTGAHELVEALGGTETTAGGVARQRGSSEEQTHCSGTHVGPAPMMTAREDEREVSGGGWETRLQAGDGERWTHGRRPTWE